jgi:DNA-binding protein HU-beta
MAGKGDIVALMAEKAGISKKEAEASYEALVAHLEDALAKDGKASLPGFGNFSTSHRKARVGRNPRTNEEIQIPASTTVKFKAGKDLKASVND